MQLKNNHIIKKFLSYLIISTLFFSCEVADPELEVFDEKDKTILVYMVGNNNLSSTAFTNISQMESGYVPTKEGDNLIIYSHTADALPKLIHLYRDSNGDTVRDTVYRFPDVNSATADALTSALSVVNTMFPANERGLILWSHGTGWLPKGYYNLYGKVDDDDTTLSQSAAPLSFSSQWPLPPSSGDPYSYLVKSFGSESDDDGDTEEMNITEIPDALPYKLDFIIFDACFMGGIEALYELKDSTDYIVASAAEVLTNGLEYGNMMQYLFDDQTDLVGMAENAYDYYNNCSGSSQSLTISVVKCSELESVAQSAANIFNKYRDNIASLNTSNIQNYFRYSDYWYFDINDFIENLAPASEAAEFTAALEKAVIYKATTGKMINITINANKFSGVSTYIPFHPDDETLEEFYETLKWEEAVNMIEEITEDSTEDITE